MQIGNSMPNLILLLISSEISRHGDNLGMGNVIFLLLFNDSAFFSLTQHFTSLGTSLLCLFNYLFTNLLNALCGQRNRCTLRARKSLESNWIQQQRKTLRVARLNFMLSVCVSACVCVFVLCAVCDCVCCCIGVFVLVFFRISCDFLAFISYFLLATRKSGKRQSQPELSTMAIGIFCWPQAELSNERVIDTIINKYRETPQTSSTFS